MEKNIRGDSAACRQPAVAGTFYPAQPQRLRLDVERYLAGAASASDAPALGVGAPASGVAASAPAASAAASSAASAAASSFAAAATLPGAPKILIVPHAGYVYSGPVAAHAYRRLAAWRDRVRRVVLLGPAHRVALRGIALPAASAFDTPLGRVPIDQAGVQSLQGFPAVGVSEAAHALEHALEVQLPFLQTVLDEFTLLPLVVGAAHPQAVAQVLQRLWGGDETVIVVSSDLSHYHDAVRCRAIDRATVEAILRGEPRLDHDAACGATPINGALIAARHRGLAPTLLDLRHSGDTAGPHDRVVGYCAVAFDAREAVDAGR